MTASEFEKRIEKITKECLGNGDGASANCGVGFWIGQVEELIEEWESEEHQYKM